MRYEYFIGLRYLRAKRRQTFVSVITLIAMAGVAVGVAALIIVLSGMVGVQDYMRDKILGFNAHIIISETGGIKSPGEVMKKLAKVEHVTGSSPFIEGQAMLMGRSRSTGALVRGIDLDTVGQVMTVGDHIIRGSLAAFETGGEGTQYLNKDLPLIAIGQDLARQLGVFYGDELTVIVPKGKCKLTPVGCFPKPIRFQVGAIFNFGFYEVDSTVALINIDVARNVFNTGDVVHGIEVKTDEIYEVDDIQDAIEKAIRTPGSSYFSRTWIQQQAQLFAALKMEQLLSGLVLSLIMVVAAFNIVSMLLMLVMEKYSDIAVLKSMGASDGGVMRIFITQGTVIGVIGTLLGVGIGLLMCYLQVKYEILAFDPSVYQFSVVPMKVTVENVCMVAGGAMLISFLTTLYPSWQAARMKPAESLRYE